MKGTRVHLPSPQNSKSAAEREGMAKNDISKISLIYEIAIALHPSIQSICHAHLAKRERMAWV